jgi:hypothetical protein
MKTEVVRTTATGAAPTRSLFLSFELFSRIGRNMMAVSTSFARLVQPLAFFPKGSLLQAFESQDVEVPNHRPMTEWERQDIAERVAAELARAGRRRGRVFDVEALELDVGVGDATPMGPAVNDRREEALHPRRPRKLAEPPTELTLRAHQLLKTIGRKYSSTRITNVVEEMIRAAHAGELGATFELEKARLRRWLKDQLHTRSRVHAEKKKGVVPHPSTFENNINSLKPIYQVLITEFYPEFVANS